MYIFSYYILADRGDIYLVLHTRWQRRYVFSYCILTDRVYIYIFKYYCILADREYIYRLLHGIFHSIPCISPRSWYQPVSPYMNEGSKRVWYEQWHVKICLSYTSTEEITDLYQNVKSFLIRIKYVQKCSYRPRKLLY